MTVNYVEQCLPMNLAFKAINHSLSECFKLDYTNLF